MQLSTQMRLPRWRSLIVVATVALLVALIGHSAMMHSDTHAAHQPHALLSLVGGEFAVNVDHTHLAKSSVTGCHNVFATAVVPRSATTLVELGVAAAVVAITAVLANLVMAAGRGPPEVPLTALTGRDLLTRFCLARR
uniref:Lipoprotein LpqS n=1 Tax=Mycobacterium riyadhense TaxID=486698 RepID=A0A653F5V0_9MYCO|nr:hypothetical protein BIN_B_05503 [Mycobacterium riyadhense]